MSDPLVVFSSCEGPHHSGDAVSNGGYKLQSLWVKLLRQHDIEAYRVTLDGSQLPWLIEPQPTISMATAQQWIAGGRDVRVVTTWMAAEMVLDLVPRPYFFDAELAHSSREHFDILRRRLLSLAKVGTHSRTIQAWYMTMFGITPDYIQEWSDTDYWKPDPARRRAGLVGYMNEGPHTAGHIQHIQQECHAAGMAAQFTEISGDEASVIAQMQQCDVFLGMNIGKHEVFGEGCPRAQQEAMHCGCLVIAYDVLGNREYIADGYTGYLVPRGDMQRMAELVKAALVSPMSKLVRERGTAFVQAQFAPSIRKWQQVKAFLDL